MTATNGGDRAVRLSGAPDSWGVWFSDDPQQPHWSRFLDEVKGAGYNATELGPWGYLPTDPDQLRTELESRDLELTGVTVIQPLADESARPQLDAEVEAAATLGKSFGVENLVLIEAMYTDMWTGAPLRSATPSEEEWAALIATVIRVGEWVKRDWDMRVVFHSHADSWVDREAEIERLLDETPADVVSLCLDTGHHAYSGGDPVAFFKRHSDRIHHLHLKDVDPQVRERVRTENLPLATAVAEGVMVEPGKGTIDYVDLRQAIRDSSFRGWAVVEQDMYPAPLDRPLPIARRTIKHLTEAGFDT